MFDGDLYATGTCPLARSSDDELRRSSGFGPNMESPQCEYHLSISSDITNKFFKPRYPDNYLLFHDRAGQMLQRPRPPPPAPEQSHFVTHCLGAPIPMHKWLKRWINKSRASTCGQMSKGLGMWSTG